MRAEGDITYIGVPAGTHVYKSRQHYNYTLIPLPCCQKYVIGIIFSWNTSILPQVFYFYLYKANTENKDLVKITNITGKIHEYQIIILKGGYNV